MHTETQEVGSASATWDEVTDHTALNKRLEFHFCWRETYAALI